MPWQLYCYIFSSLIFIAGCVILICVLLKKRKSKVRPHISVATKSAAPDSYPPLPQQQQQPNHHHQHPSAPPPPRPPPPPHMINGGIYRAHDVAVSSPIYPGDSQQYHSPPYPTNPPSYGPNPPVYYESIH